MLSKTLLKNRLPKPPTTPRHTKRTLYHSYDPQSHLLNEQDDALFSMALNFANEKMVPYAREWDNEKIFPLELLREAGEIGFGGIRVGEKYGGSGMSRRDSSIVFEALSAGCTSTATYISIHNMVASLIDEFGSEEVKEKYLPKLCTMELLSSYCLTEPGSGSDAGSLKTKADDNGDHYVLNGSKSFISGAGASGLYLVMARTEEGITAFLIDKDAPGLSFGSLEKKMGWNTQPTRAVFMENCIVPKENVLGQVGKGFNIALKGLDSGRTNIASCSIGGAQACFNYAKDYVSTRKQFGKSISSFQNTQFKFSEMAIDIHASRLMVRNAADNLDKDIGPTGSVQAAMSKKFATEKCFNVVDNCLQMLGGYGYLNDYPIERYLRDLRVHRILEGSNEVMQLIIARDIFKQ